MHSEECDGLHAELLFGRGTTGGKHHGIGSGNVSNPEGGRLWGEKTHNKGQLTKKAKKGG